MAELKKIEDTPKKKTSPRKKKRKQKTPFRNFLWNLVMVPLAIAFVAAVISLMFTTLEGWQYLWVPLVAMFVLGTIGAILAAILGIDLD